MKRCFKCGEIKELDFFYRHSQMGDGHLNKCKECNKRDVIENRNKRLEYYREYDRERYRLDPVRKELALNHVDKNKKENNKRYSEKYPIKRMAHQLFDNAKRDGRVFYPSPSICEICGEEKKLQGHHFDYSMPFDVNWLCTRCRAVVHAVQRTAERLGLKSFNTF